MTVNISPEDAAQLVARLTALETLPDRIAALETRIADSQLQIQETIRQLAAFREDSNRFVLELRAAFAAQERQVKELDDAVAALQLQRGGTVGSGVVDTRTIGKPK